MHKTGIDSPFLTHIKLENFMGYQFWEHDLYDVSVIIGNNTSGKTTILNGLQVALGGFLQCMRVLPATKQYRRQISTDECFSPYDDFSRSYKPSREKTRVSVRSNLMDVGPFLSLPIGWYRQLSGTTTTHNQECIGDLQRWVDYVLDKRDDDERNRSYTEDSVLPILLSFGTNRLSSQIRMKSSAKERMTRVECAYKAALMDKVDYAGAHGWFLNADKRILDGKEFDGTKTAFIRALETAIPYLSEVGIDASFLELDAVVSVDGRAERHRFTQMSDGLKAMINLVSEIAHRCIELNGFLGEKSILETPGIVLIDEIDIYLHPKWQRHVLEDLKKAFPKIQFVVTTHSPFVVQSISEQQLIALDDETDIEGNPQKESLEEIAENRMGMKNLIRSKKFNLMVKKAEVFYQLVKNGSEVEKDEELKKLEMEFSDDPAYIALLKAERGGNETR